MTDNVQPEIINAAQSEISDNASNLGSAQAAQAPTESMVPQGKVNELVGSAKQKGYQKALDEIREQQQLLAQQPSNQAPNNSTANNNVDLASLIDSRLGEFQKQQQAQHQEAAAQAEAHRILSELAAKTEDAKKRYSDFDEKVGSIAGAFESAPQLLHYANTVDNSGDILYDLANNPTKIANLAKLGEMNPQLALMEIQRLSSSIKQNQNAAPAPASPDALRPVKSSNVGTDNGNLSVRDFKAKYRG
jgi:hypothetical protein